MHYVDVLDMLPVYCECDVFSLLMDPSAMYPTSASLFVFIVYVLLVYSLDYHSLSSVDLNSNLLGKKKGGQVMGSVKVYNTQPSFNDLGCMYASLRELLTPAFGRGRDIFAACFVLRATERSRNCRMCTHKRSKNIIKQILHICSTYGWPALPSSSDPLHQMNNSRGLDTDRRATRCLDWGKRCS